MTVIATVRSTSNPAVTYEIRKGGDGRTYCSCKAWAFGKGADCKHMVSLKAQLVG